MRCSLLRAALLISLPTEANNVLTSYEIWRTILQWLVAYLWLKRVNYSSLPQTEYKTDSIC